MTAIADALRQCPDCGGLVEAPQASAEVPCPNCEGMVRFALFPALTRTLRPAAALAISSVGDSSCYFHEQSVAAAACDGCGRFLCGLCRIEWGNRIVCPACVGAAAKTGDMLTFARTRYDSLALALLALSVPFFVFSFLTVPAAVGLGIVALRRPGSLVKRGKRLAWLAIGLGLLILGGGVWLIVYAVFKAKS